MRAHLRPLPAGPLLIALPHLFDELFVLPLASTPRKERFEESLRQGLRAPAEVSGRRTRGGGRKRTVGRVSMGGGATTSTLKLEDEGVGEVMVARSEEEREAER